MSLPEDGGAAATTLTAHTDTLVQPPTNRSHRPVSLAPEYRAAGTRGGDRGYSAPFDRANIYRARGWLGTIPLPEAKKKDPPFGFTGNGAPYPDNDQIRAWSADPRWRGANIAIRMPPDVLGIDVDDYDDKPGGKTLSELEEKYGPLPATYRSTSRLDDPVSGIRWYRVPRGLKWPGGFPGIELVRQAHRYAVVWPSVHDKTGNTYQWLTPDGRLSAAPPRPTDLPALPESWVQGLTGGATQDDQPHVDPASSDNIKVWREAAPKGSPCQVVERLVGQATAELLSGQSRHDAIAHTVMALVRAADQGHKGVPQGIETVYRAFHRLVSDDPSRPADGEWHRILAGAIAKVAQNPTLKKNKRCCKPPKEQEPERRKRDPEPGHVVLDDVREFIKSFVVLPSEHALVATTLWVAHAHGITCFESTPRIGYLAPERECGKTRALEVIGLLVPNPMHAVNASPPALFRAVADQPTLLYDEIDTVFGPRAKENEEIRGLLNAGHRRSGVAYRCVGEGANQTVAPFPAFCAVAFAGIGDLPDTIMSRTVVIPMRRRMAGEKVESFRFRIHEPIGHELRDRLEAWIDSCTDELIGAWPEIPKGVTDRAADVWEPLLAIAEAAGGDWPEGAREACAALVKAAAESGTESLGVRLLADLRTVFGDAEAMSTEQILTALHGLEESPWRDLKGKPLDARGLANRLRKYGVRPKTVRITKVISGGIAGAMTVEQTPKGYKREDLWDPWNRYLPSPPGEKSATSATSETSQVNEPTMDEPMGFVADGSATTEPIDQPIHESLTWDLADVADVADLAPEEGGDYDDWSTWPADTQGATVNE